MIGRAAAAGAGLYTVSGLLLVGFGTGAGVLAVAWLVYRPPVRRPVADRPEGVDL